MLLMHSGKMKVHIENILGQTVKEGFGWQLDAKNCVTYINTVYLLVLLVISTV